MQYDGKPYDSDQTCTFSITHKLELSFADGSGVELEIVRCRTARGIVST